MISGFCKKVASLDLEQSFKCAFITILTLLIFCLLIFFMMDGSNGLLKLPHPGIFKLYKK